MANSSHPAIAQEYPPEHNEFFNQQWTLYQKVLNQNYMGHREIYQALHQWLRHHCQQYFTMLDLGCGDATFASQALLHTPLQAYWGVDLSESALAIARENMANLPGEKQFIQADLFDWVIQQTQPQAASVVDAPRSPCFNVILASFALHHWQLDDKVNLISRLPQLLQPGGIFLLIDIVRRPNEDRAAYVNRYMEHVRQSWLLLTADEILRVEQHISTSDYPETQANLYAIGHAHHFSGVDCLYSDPLETAQLLCFSR